MSRQAGQKIVLVTRRTRLDELIIRFNTASQARFYLEHLGADFADYQAEDHRYKAALAETQGILAALGRLQTLDRTYLPNYLFGPEDQVVVLGQDGLVANVLKYLDGQPVLGVNPDPERWEGVLLPFRVADLKAALPALLRRELPLRRVTMAKASLNNGQTLYGVNDLFIGQRSHTSARYRLEIGERGENHSSSGIIVSTGLGSTGWLRSILTGAAGIAASLDAGDALPAPPPPPEATPWDANHLWFSVREPWPSTTSSATITFGRITQGQPLRVLSQMTENGVIFSDGIEKDFVEFQSGVLATIGVAERQGVLAGRA
jgi:NAD kinase